METIKQNLFTNWHLMRLLRLFIGVTIAVQAFQMHDAIMGFFSAFFMFQAVTNTGCCGAQSCAAPIAKDNPDQTEIVEFEEIKPNNHGNN
ncbi:MAG TPA: hypothetical protein VK174_17980 [Chitinophagales bacterium]|nr:hypothetical protein [Chitinophagales bacterium]